MGRLVNAASAADPAAERAQSSSCIPLFRQVAAFRGRPWPSCEVISYPWPPAVEGV